MSPPHKTESIISISESSIVRTNLGFVLTILGLTAVGVLGYATTKGSIEAVIEKQLNHALDLTAIDAAHGARMSALENDWRSMREILIRVDERTEQIRREQVELRAQMKAK
jgi:hypothetical protein